MQDQSAPPPIRQRRRRKEARPAEIITAAMELWADRGFAATRLEDVARGAGVAKGTIYLYFPSKEALFEAAVEDRLVSVMDQAGQMAQAFTGTTDQLLRQFISVVYTQIHEQKLAVLLKVLISEGHRFPRLTSFYQDAAIHRVSGMIGAILSRGAARGEIRTGLETLDARLIFAPALVSGLWGMVFTGGREIDRERFMQAHLDLLLNGLLCGGGAARPDQVR
jgi:TetR/AcrR family transcriptional regulator